MGGTFTHRLGVFLGLDPAAPFADDGANFGFASQSVYPAAFYDATGDQTWVAWEGFLGGLRAARVAVYDHASSTWSRAYTISQYSMVDDAHGTPAICMDADGRVHAFFGSHDSTLRHSVTVSARDPSTWRELASPVGSATYPHPVLIGSNLYLFIRTNGRQSLTRLKGTVSNGTVTWGAGQHVFTFTGGRFYLGSLFADGTTIHGFATYGDSSFTYSRDIYHFRYDTTDESVDNTDGSVSTAVGSQPVSLATADTSYKIYDQTTNVSSLPVACLTPDGKLHVAFQNSAGSPFNIDYMNYSGGSWSSAATVTTTTGRDVAGNGYHGGLTLVPRADNTVELWYPNDDANAFPLGGVMKRIVRSSGETWGASQDILSPQGAPALDRPTTVRDADPDLYVLFTEDTTDGISGGGAVEADANAGDLKMYAYGAGGFVARDLTAASDPGTASASDDPYFYNVALQTTFTGANGSTSFTDASRYAHTLTAVGNAQIQSNKLDLDGSGDYVTAADSILWQFGSRVTIELLGVEFDDTASDQVLIGQYRASAGLRSWGLSYDGVNGGLQFFMVDPAGDVREIVCADFTPSTGGVEYDIALSWDGFMYSILVNGVRLNQAGGPESFANGSQVLSIGCDFDSSNTARRFFNGRIAALRITRGINRTGTGATYTRHALPLPTAQATLTDSQWANVLLLLETLGDGTIRDASPYDWPITKAGNAAVSTSVEPFSNANSVALDGTGDYLSLPDDALLEFGSGDFTIELFARHSGNTTLQHYVSKWNATGNQRSWALRYRGDAATDIIDMPMSSDGSTTATTVATGAWTPAVNQFYHVAMSRNGNDKRVFIDGTQNGSTNTTAVNPFDTTAGLLIGEITGGAQTMNGYISEMRITKGNARYTSNFTAPSAAFPRG